MSGKDRPASGGPTRVVAQGHIPSLDGFRMAAVLLVLVAHAGYSHVVPGGFGVTVFFFLSGYLITTLMMREHARTGRIDLPAFFARRFLRLMPPLLVTLALAYGLAAVDVLEGSLSPRALLGQLFYVFNYQLVFSGAHDPGVAGLDVRWSLAVEEHFYLIYPFAFIGLTRMRTLRGRTIVLCMVLAAILAWRLVLVHALGAAPDRTYLATDTRLDSILWGCLLAHLAPVMVRRVPQGFWAMTGVLAVCGLILLATFAYREPAFRETWRYTLQGAALMPVFHYAVHASRTAWFAPLNTAVAARFATWSYAIYLGHFVIMAGLLRHGVGEDAPLVLLGVALPLSCLYAELMNRLVERPVAELRRRARPVLPAIPAAA